MSRIEIKVRCRGVKALESTPGTGKANKPRSRPRRRGYPSREKVTMSIMEAQMMKGLELDSLVIPALQITSRPCSSTPEPQIFGGGS
jgi:hypothetical protein